MSSVCRNAVAGRALALAACTLWLAVACRAEQPEAHSEVAALRVCADPNNMPFSNRRGEGLENQLAELVARDLGVPVEYTWWPQRRGFIRNTMRAGLCDVVMGVPAGYELVSVTRAYYRSGYVFVTRAASGLDISSFDDPRLRSLSVGVQLVGDDYANTPPAHALARRGITDNVRGYMVYGDYRLDVAGAGVVEAVVKSEIDIAIVWGPLAGYMSRRIPGKLQLTPVSRQIESPYLPFVFDISVGVRRDAEELRLRIDRILLARREEISRLLDDYGVPHANRSANAG